MRTFFTAVVSMLIFMTFITEAAAAKPADGERLLLIKAAGGSQNLQEQTAQEAVYDGMVEYMTDRGYRVVDKQAAERASMQIAATHEIDPVINRAASYGLQFLAEHTVHFKTTTILKDPEKGIGALVRVKAKLVDNTGARIIAAKLAEASSTGHTAEDAIEKAARTAAKKLAEQLCKGLDQFVQQNGNEGRTITMVFEGSAAKAERLISMLESASSVAAVKEVESGGGKTTVEIICKNRRDILEREMVKSAVQQRIKLEKVRSEGNRSTWKIM